MIGHVTHIEPNWFIVIPILVFSIAFIWYAVKNGYAKDARNSIFR